MRDWISPAAVVLGAAVAAAPAASQTLQQAFDAAGAAYADRRMDEAAAGYAAVIERLKPAATRQPRILAIARSRYGQALMALRRYPEAVAQFDAALPSLAADADREERFAMLTDLGMANEMLNDYPAAQKAFEAALAIPVADAHSNERLALRVSLARVTMFAHPDIARREMDVALPQLERVFAEQPRRDWLADFYGLRGRIELNHGKPAEARVWFQKALDIAGGLTTRVSIADTRIRSDLAIANHLDGRSEIAMKYLAHSGAGRLKEGAFASAVSTPLPACGETTGLRPDDVAVIELAISDKGAVTSRSAVYVSRIGTEVEFLRAVGQWSWSPKELAEIDPFWRSAVRLEMRCQGRGNSSASLWATFAPAVDTWFQSVGAAPAPVAESDAAELPILLAESASRETRFGRESIQLAPVLLGLSFNSVAEPAVSREAALRLSAIAEAAKAPPDVRGVLAVLTLDRGSSRNGPAELHAIRRRLIAALEPLIARLDAAGDAPRALAYARIVLGQTLEVLRDRSRAATVFETVATTDTASLPANDRIRQLAQLQLATIRAAQGQIAEAKSLVAATGLTPEQCALVDVVAIKKRGDVTSGDIPEVAYRYGFDGWVRIGYDVDSGGRPQEIRTVLAYPPFVYGAPTERAIARFRFEPIFRDGAAAGCVDRLQSVRYSMP